MPARRPATGLISLPAVASKRLWWGRRFACPRDTRPRPKLRRLNQPRINRILLDVNGDAVQFFSVPHPMVIGFVLPEGLAGLSQDSIGRTCRRPFEPAHDLGNLEPGQHQQMNVVRHHQPRAKFVELLVPFTGDEGIANGMGDDRILQPCGTAAGLMQGSVGSYKRMAGMGRCPRAQLRRKRAPETPRQGEVSIVRMVVRQSPAPATATRTTTRATATASTRTTTATTQTSAARPAFFSRNFGLCR
jgi:hypothetical protein